MSNNIKRVAFVHSHLNTTVAYSHAIASISGIIKLKRPSIEQKLFVFSKSDFEPICDQIRGFRPDFVLFSSLSSQWHFQLRIAKYLRTIAVNCIFLAGGTHLTARPNSEHQDIFDLVVIGEGENEIINLLEASDRASGMIHGQTVEDLTSLPMPNFQLFPRELLLAYPSLIFSRGCPYRCNYCMSRFGGLDKTVRWKSVEQAILEVKEFVRVSGCKEIYFDDDTILKNPKWIEAFCVIYKAEIDIPFLCNARPETVKPKVVENLASAGCIAIGIGIESGSERIRKLIGRPMSDEKIICAFRTAQNAGIKTWSFNMVGLPTETIQDFKKTIEINDLAKVNDVRISVFTPYPGSPMGESVEIGHEGYFRSPEDLPEDIKSEYINWVLHLESSGRLWLTKAEKELLLNSIREAI